LLAGSIDLPLDRVPARHAALAQSGQASMGTGYELDAVASAVIGGVSLAGGQGRISGTVIGTVILGVMTSRFTFVGVDAYLQDIVKGIIIVAAVVADRTASAGARRPDRGHQGRGGGRAASASHGPDHWADCGSALLAGDSVLR